MFLWNFCHISDFLQWLETKEVNIVLILSLSPWPRMIRDLCLTRPITALQHWLAPILTLTWSLQPFSSHTTLWGQWVTKKACRPSYQSPQRHLFNTENHRKYCWPPRQSLLSCGKEGFRLRQKEIETPGERRLSAGSRSVPLSSRKVSPVMYIEPKWRRGECGVATDNNRQRLGERPQWRTENRARGTRGDRLQGKGVTGLKKGKYLKPVVSGGLGRTTDGEEGRDGGKKGKERSRAHPLRATPPSHNPLLLAWVRLSVHEVTEGRLLTHSHCDTHAKRKYIHTQTTISNTPTAKRSKTDQQ